MSKDVLTPEMREQITKLLTRFPEDRKRSAALMAIHIVQDLGEGWVSEAQLDAIAEILEQPPIALYEVATFYTMCKRKPQGKHLISICTNLPCQLSGCEEIVMQFKKRLGIDFGETTPDGKFTLEEVECLGACVNAPMCSVGKKYVEHLTPEKVDEILAELQEVS